MKAQLAGTAVGLWLMAAPSILGYGNPARMNDLVVGPMIASFAFIAVWEVTRGVRRVNLILAAWLLVAPWVLGYGIAAAVNSTVVARCLLLLASMGGSVTQAFGVGWTSLVARDGARREQRRAARP